jgi:MOSC domain-containing protein YiiM
MACQLLSVQTGATRKVHIQGRSILTAIRKTAVAGPVPVMPLGLLGDEQADPSVHGGLDKAVYAYPSEHYAFWRQARQDAGVADIDDQLPFGSMGENLTLAGLLEQEVWVGDVLRFADCALRVVQPREPCFKFNAAMGYSGAVKAMALSGRCGFYLAVDTPGTVQAGESFVLEPGSRQMGIPELFKAKLFKHLH